LLLPPSISILPCSHYTKNSLKGPPEYPQFAHVRPVEEIGSFDEGLGIGNLKIWWAKITFTLEIDISSR